MNAIFYDKKHRCEVSNEQIMTTKLVVTLAITQDDHEEKLENKTITGAYEMVIGPLCYKTKDCPEFQNWDRFLDYNDLVFLRFEH